MFGFGKQARKTPQEEWQEDVRAAMASPSTSCRQDIAEMLWTKYKKLADGIESAEDFQRVYDLIGQTVANFQWPLEALMWMGDVCEGVLHKPDQAAHWFKTAADQGSPNGARNYADMIMAGMVPGGPGEAFPYYRQASEGGVAEASFVLGEFLRKAGKRDEALTAYRKSVAQGYAMAQMRIDQMNG